jgi:hypothetical protein
MKDGLTNVRDFAEVWESLNKEGRKKSLRFLLELYGKDELFAVLSEISNLLKVKGGKKE